MVDFMCGVVVGMGVLQTAVLIVAWWFEPTADDMMRRWGP